MYYNVSLMLLLEIIFIASVVSAFLYHVFLSKRYKCKLNCKKTRLDFEQPIDHVDRVSVESCDPGLRLRIHTPTETFDFDGKNNKLDHLISR